MRVFVAKLGKGSVDLALIKSTSHEDKL